MRKFTLNENWERCLGEKPTLMSLTVPEIQAVNLPDDFILELPRSADAASGAACGFFPGGQAFYTKKFRMPEEWKDQSLLLDIDGAYSDAEVRVNGEYMGIHPYGYTPWQISLDGVAIPGEENEIEVVTRCLQPNSRWYSGGGLYRQVCLWIGSRCHVRPWDAFFTTPAVGEKESVLRLEAVITNTADCAAEGRLTLACCGAERTAAVSVPAGAAVKTVLELTVRNAPLWSVEEPALCEASVTLDTNLGQDTLTKNVGFRCIDIDARQGMRLNGRPIKLLGGCLHHDNALLGAAAYPRAEERKLELLKEAGYNAVRCAHNPPSDSFLDACDRLGILVMDEAFDCWRLGKNSLDYHLHYEKWWRDDITAMVKRDRNHPSIFCWSIGNEIAEAGGTSGGPEQARLMADFVRELDPTRPVTMGMHSMIRSQRKPGQPARMPFRTPQRSGSGDSGTPEEKQSRMRRMMADPKALDTVMSSIVTNNMGDGWLDGVDVWGEISQETCSHLDLVGYNYFHPRYERDRASYPDRVICATETHALTTYDYYRAMMENSHVIGDFIWTAYDNLGEAGAGRVMHALTDMMTGMLGPYPWLSCCQGDLDLDGNRRPQSYFRKILWGKDRGIHVFAKDPRYAHLKPYGLGWQWNDVFRSWTWGEENEGKDIYVEAYADCDEVEFVLNGVSRGRAAVEKLTASMILPYEQGTLQAIAWKDGRAVARDELHTAGAPAAIELAADRDTLRADGMDLSFIRARITDANGVTVPTDAVTLRAQVQEGHLAGFGSGNPCTDENYGTGCRRVWQGLALLAVRAGRQAGGVTVTVEADGLPARKIEIHWEESTV